MTSKRFPFLRYPLRSFRDLADTLPPGASTKLRQHLREARYSVRLLRYWWVGQALREESELLGRPLVVVDLGCERGWLKHFTPEGAVQRWIGLDWNPAPEVAALARYDEVHFANFDESLPLPDRVADAVVSLHVFEHLPRPGSTMAEVSRLLKPGGIFLGGAPTMPGWLARLRERFFRRRLARGKQVPGSHITVISPARWRSLATDTGLEVEFLTGSHAFRHTGSALENWRWWVRLNQAWGALFPALGSEACLKARRGLPWAEQAVTLRSRNTHWRPAWISLGIVGAAAAIALAIGFVSHHRQRDAAAVTVWMNAHQEGGEVFLVATPSLHWLTSERNDTLPVPSTDDLPGMLDETPDAHVLISFPSALKLAQLNGQHCWRVDSRLDLDDTDYLLLSRGAQGTPLHEYLRGLH